MRIAQLANFIGPVSGGMKVAIEALGRGYVAAGHDRIFVTPGEKDTVTETEFGIQVQVASPKVSQAYRMIFRPWRALDVLGRFNPTSIEVSDKWTLSPAGRWARKRGIGAALFSHERLDDMAAGWLRRQFGVEAVIGALNRRLAKTFDIVVVTSQYSAGEFVDTGADLRLVPLGVDLDTFNPALGVPWDAPDYDPGVPQICYVGRMSHEKYPQLGVATAVELHRRGVPFRLHMYGTGPDVAELKALAEGAPVTFHGFVSGRGEVANCYARSDLSFSICPTETFGLAVLEALASGTPVVTADRGGARELVDQSCGEWGAPDPVALADATQRLIERRSPDLRAAARARAELYPWQASVDRMLALHEELSS